jgi:GTPase SAR1 family protein
MTITISILGDKGTGKTSLLHSFTNGETTPEITYMNCQGSSESSKITFFEYDCINNINTEESSLLPSLPSSFKDCDACIIGKSLIMYYDYDYY